MNDLKTRLAAVMPPAIQALRSVGGPTNQRIMNAHRSWRSWFGDEGDQVYAGLPKDQRGEYVAYLADCLAVMAFQPGGVKLHDLRFFGWPDDEKAWKQAHVEVEA